MNKYDKVWQWVREQNADRIVVSFSEIETVAGVPLDHSFLSYKKELIAYGFKVGKISMKAKTVTFEREGGASR